MIRAVSEFGRTIVRIAGGPAGRLSCFTEVPYQLDGGDGNPPEELRPDGIVQVVRGKTRWVALVEVKVGKASLDPEQVDKYHRLARDEGANALITVSNQPALPDGRPPVSLDGRRLRSIPVSHFSWERLLSEAQLLSRKKEVADPDQKWMLDEWIHYVGDPKSRIIVPPDLGSHWGDVLKAARTGALDQSDSELRDVARCWMGYLRKVALQLRAKLGVEVQIRLSRKEKSDSELHLERLVASVRANGPLSGVLRVPDAAGDIRIEVFFTSVAFGGRCKQAGVRPSMGSVGDCYDNAMSESFFATLECELIDRYRFKTQAEARMAVFGFIEGWYNPRRRHSSLGYESPMSFEENHANRSDACPAAGGTATFNEPAMLLLPCASGTAEASDSKGSWEQSDNTST